MKVRTITKEEWERDGTRRFGGNKLDWKFVCPACGYVASVREWFEAKAPEGAVAFSCVGRFANDVSSVRGAFSEGDGPCDYAGGGLIGLNPVKVIDGPKSHHCFEFADADFVNKVAEVGSAG